MRLSVVRADLVSSRLIQDWNKLYPQAKADQLHHWVHSDQRALFVAIFNERHVGSVKAEKTETGWILSGLVVREVTRKRGIGKWLWKEVLSQLRGEIWLNTQDQDVEQPDPNALKAFLLKQGIKLPKHQLAHNLFIRD